MAKNKSVSRRAPKRCGLCGKAKNLTETDCCGNPICDDERNYALFSNAGNSWYRDHRHYTLWAHHHNEEHSGNWKDCEQCRRSFETEMYVWYGTNEYNFEKLPNPPSYEPTRCAGCGRIIKLGTDGYSESGDKYWCQRCTAKEMAGKFRPRR